VPPVPIYTVRIAAVRVSDDDGQRAARVTPAQVTAWLAFANDVFRPAGVRFDFHPDAGDWTELRNSGLNGLAGTDQDDWPLRKREADDVAATFPDQLVVFFRHGPGGFATGGGFSWFDYDFVAMPGWLDDEHCGHDHIDALAHELGHHLGLPHTFTRVFLDSGAADAFVSANAGDLRLFDGDGIGDTPPDPGIRTTECQAVPSVTLGGVRLPLPRRNVMSYYDERDSLSPDQIERVRWFVRERLAHRMKLPRNDTAGAPTLEAEALFVTGAEGCRPRRQAMDPFGAGNWSGATQLSCRSPAGAPVAVTARLSLARRGRYRITLFATRSPDYGIVEVLLDGRPLGAPYDAWAPAVLASGAIPLGEHALARGRHELVFRTRGKNAASSGFHLGIDALTFAPAGRGRVAQLTKAGSPSEGSSILPKRSS
jgi:hypothetical protein